MRGGCVSEGFFNNQCILIMCVKHFLSISIHSQLFYGCTKCSFSHTRVTVFRFSIENTTESLNVLQFSSSRIERLLLGKYWILATRITEFLWQRLLKFAARPVAVTLRQLVAFRQRASYKSNSNRCKRFPQQERRTKLLRNKLQKSEQQSRTCKIATSFPGSPKTLLYEYLLSTLQLKQKLCAHSRGISVDCYCQLHTVFFLESFQALIQSR